MQAGLNGLFLAKDLVIFYLFWEVTLIPSVLMLGIWGGAQRRQAALKYLIYAVAGSFVMLVAILAIKPLSGAASYRLADLLLATPSLPSSVQVWLFIGFLLAFAVKLPLWPLHVWLPDFHEQNHPSGVADVAGTLYKVGGFGLFAWALPLLPEAARLLSPLLMSLAAFTALYAAVIATSQTHLKRMLAYASLSHMGIIGVGLFGLHLAGLNGAMLLLAAQMLSTGGLFLLSGMLYERRESFELSAYGGLAKSAPAFAAITLFVLFTSIGVPGLANFPGEFMSLLGAFQSNAFLAALATLSVVAAGVYGVNMYQRLFQAEQEKGVADLRSLETLILIPILAGILWLGLVPAPQVERIEAQSLWVAQGLEAKIAGGPK
jgi:NADH-quinone oxidoreductase subunit M